MATQKLVLATSIGVLVIGEEVVGELRDTV